MSLWLAVLSGVALLFHMILSGATVIRGLDWAGTSKMAHAMTGALMAEKLGLLCIQHLPGTC